MRVVTVSGFGRRTKTSTEQVCTIYQGNAWLFRFTIQSPDHFFRDELRNFVYKVFDIDPRQIYMLLLRGHPGAGLYDVQMYVSFLESPDEKKVGLLQLAVPRSKSDHWGHS